VFENGVLRSIFGPKSGEITGKWRKLQNKLHNLYISPKYQLVDQVQENDVGGACGTHGRGEKSVQGFSWKARREEPTRKTEA
jgi:hypothetical protein